MKTSAESARMFQIGEELKGRNFFATGKQLAKMNIQRT